MNKLENSYNLARAMVKNEVDDRVLYEASIDIKNYLIKENEFKKRVMVGGEYLNHYIKHVINRVVRNGELKGIYLYNISSIYEFLSMEENIEYLNNTGLPSKDIPKVLGFIKRISENKRWERIIFSEIKSCNEEEILSLIKFYKISNLRLHEILYERMSKQKELSWRYYIFIFGIVNVEEVENVIKDFLVNADVVNIKYPILMPSNKRSIEYIIIKNLLKLRREYSKVYEELIDLVIECNNANLVVDGLKLIKEWKIPFLKKISKEKIYYLLSKENISEENCNFLREIISIMNREEFNFDYKFF